MRAVFLSVLLMFAFSAAAQAADRKISDFYGVYLGHGSEEPVPGDAAHGDQGKMTRFSQVVIRPEKAEGGFSIEWSTLKLEGDELPKEADTKTYVQTFRPSDKPTVFRDVTSGDLNLGADTAWAVINGDTLSMVQISVAPDGNYYVVQYDRTLTEKGMDVRFTRFENSRIVRAIKLSLLKGPAKVN
ncbi:MAG: hypothetical protein SGI91_21465 [Alphaproteobacteria bacterium]|nr:hypothetical protein [Alphaproteobacteria bacterium]